ncbi:MAG TPA: response regulator [Thermoanaerobaculia bacterium]|jgi:CheY-like chemotaxis protein|nr:response regulator [Thermoanaerobaculia bacterium]
MRNGNVLVVEDDDTIRRLLVEFLRAHESVGVDSARDGVEALHRIVTTPYSVIVLDVLMPKMSGVDVLDSLAALTSDPSVKSLDDPPAVLVITSAERTSLPDDAIFQRAPTMVRRVFRKPVAVEELAKSVEMYLRT